MSKLSTDNPLAVGILAFSIVSGVWALYKKPPAEGIKKKDRVEHERKNRRKDQIYARRSVLAMIVAILSILVALGILSWESSNLNTPLNSSKEKDSVVFVVIECPNYSIFQHEANFSDINFHGILFLNQSDSNTVKLYR